MRFVPQSESNNFCLKIRNIHELGISYLRAIYFNLTQKRVLLQVPCICKFDIVFIINNFCIDLKCMIDLKSPRLL